MRSCPLCEANNASVLRTLHPAQFVNATYAPDYRAILGVTDDGWDVVQCRCGMIYAAEIPTFLEALYTRAIDPAKSRAEALRPQWVAHQLRLASHLLDAGCKRILDYGCGAGTIVRAIGCDGYDPYAANFRARPVGPYDGIVLSDVLEHVPDPRLVLRTCRNLLRDDGLIAVHVPTYPNAINPWEHLNYFTGRTLRAMLRAEGFEPREISADIGLRPNLRGARKMGNAAKSFLRFFLGPTSTAVLGLKH